MKSSIKRALILRVVAAVAVLAGVFTLAFVCGNKGKDKHQSTYEDISSYPPLNTQNLYPLGRFNIDHRGLLYEGLEWSPGDLATYTQRWRPTPNGYCNGKSLVDHDHAHWGGVDGCWFKNDLVPLDYIYKKNPPQGVTVRFWVLFWAFLDQIFQATRPVFLTSFVVSIYHLSV